MDKSKVFFTNLHTTPSSNLLDKMERLIKRAGIESIDFKDQFVAIKIHFGEPGNLAYLRPNYAARLATLLRSWGAKPFLTDCNTLYSGRRANAVDHLQSAMENGYNPISAQCQVIIADGLKGTEYREIPLNGEYCKAPKIGSALADADIVISMTHFKGHEQAGFGGALKNLGMGGASVGGKLELHCNSQPKIETENCKGCNICVKHCAHDAIHLNQNHKAEIDYTKCVGCGQCVNPEKRNEPSCKNEVVQNLQKRSVQKSTSAQYKKAPKKTYFFGAFLLLVFWLSHQKSLTLNNKEYIIFGF